MRDLGVVWLHGGACVVVGGEGCTKPPSHIRATCHPGIVGGVVAEGSPKHGLQGAIATGC